MTEALASIVAVVIVVAVIIYFFVFTSWLAEKFGGDFFAWFVAIIVACNVYPFLVWMVVIVFAAIVAIFT